MKRGFSLVELLAVIVILAIIATIATPIVLNIIKNSKEEAIKRSVSMYQNSVRSAFARYQLENGAPSNGIYKGTRVLISEDGNTKIEVEYDSKYEIFCSEIIYQDGNLTINYCSHETLQTIINNSKDGSTIVLDMDYMEQVSIPFGKTLTIDLNGHTIHGPKLKESWVGTISNYGNLTLKGDGIVNENSGGYAILNHGTMVIDGGTYKALFPDTKSSLVENGYRDTSKYIEGKESEFPKLTINGGVFEGGVANIKNDSNGFLIVNNGTFSNKNSVNLLNWNEATINGGTFIVEEGKKTNINNAPSGTSKVDAGLVTINAGQFNSDYILMGLTDDVFVKFNDGSYTGDIINPLYVTANVICKAVTTATTGNVPSGYFNPGDEYTCSVGNTTATENLKFFVLQNTGEKIYLIMDRNLTGTVAYSSDGISTNGPVTAAPALAEKTSNWNKLSPLQIVLPTYNQIFAVNNSETLTNTVWLWDHTTGSPTTPYINWGYWTSDFAKDGINAWKVTNNAKLSGSGYLVSRTDLYGVRPVIILDKIQLK